MEQNPSPCESGTCGGYPNQMVWVEGHGGMHSTCAVEVISSEDLSELLRHS